MVATLPRLIQPKSRRPFSPQSSQLTHLVAELDEKFKEFEKLLQLANTSNSAQIAAIELQNLLLENKPLLKKAGKYDIFIQQLITFCAIAGISLMLAKATPTISTTPSSIQPVRQPSIERVQAVQGLNTFFTSRLATSPKAEPNFANKVRQVANNIGADPVDLLTLMSFESAGTLSPSQRGPHVPGQGSAVGLIQFMPGTAAELGTTVEQLAAMSPVEQLDYVEKYLVKRGFPKGGTLKQLYSTVFAGHPHASGTISDGYHTLDSAVERMNREHRSRAIAILNGNTATGKLANTKAITNSWNPQFQGKPKTGVGNLILGFFQPHKAQIQAASTISATKLVSYMEKQGYEISRNPGEVNIVHIRNGSTARDLFEDKRIVLQFVNGVPKITGEWAETTKPGLAIVRQPINSKGAIAIAPGQYKAWQVGTHVGSSGRHAHEALIQTGGSITGYRDSDRNGTFETIDRGFFGVNIHAPWGNSDRVEDRSAGCMVTATKADHKAFMKLVKSDPRFLGNPNFVFAATIIDGEKL
jgi:hypothetical protein